jgi:putative DNA primase/helicase
VRNLENEMMKAALNYAKANIPVMPLHWICEDRTYMGKP